MSGVADWGAFTINPAHTIASGGGRQDGLPRDTRDGRTQCGNNDLRVSPESVSGYLRASSCG